MLNRRSALQVLNGAVVGLAAAGVLGRAGAASAQAAPLEVTLGALMRKRPPPPLYEIDPVPADEGAAGAGLAIVDNNTTGRFTQQHYTLNQVVLEDAQAAPEAAVKLADGGAGLLLVDLGADELLAVTDALKDRDVVIFNVSAADDRLRGADCRGRLFHVAPSRAMLTDALAQYFAAKRWSKLFLIVGPKPADALYAEAMRASARKFGLKIAAEKPWDFGPLARARGDSVTQADALIFTRGTDYDIMVVADEAGDFGDYIPFHTWDARLVAGTQGLVATSWHRAQDAWGSAQLQSRFYKEAKRFMRPVDYQAWVAVRAVGEAVTRLKSAAPAAIAGYLVSDAFQLAAFKGVPVTFRPWDRQLRQPILLAQPSAIVGVAPLPGFLHQRTVLDTLGTDLPETACHQT